MYFFIPLDLFEYGVDKMVKNIVDLTSKPPPLLCVLQKSVCVCVCVCVRVHVRSVAESR